MKRFPKFAMFMVMVVGLMALTPGQKAWGQQLNPQIVVEQQRPAQSLAQVTVWQNAMSVFAGQVADTTRGVANGDYRLPTEARIFAPEVATYLTYLAATSSAMRVWEGAYQSQEGFRQQIITQNKLCGDRYAAIAPAEQRLAQLKQHYLATVASQQANVVALALNAYRDAEIHADYVKREYGRYLAHQKVLTDAYEKQGRAVSAARQNLEYYENQRLRAWKSVAQTYNWWVYLQKVIPSFPVSREKLQPVTQVPTGPLPAQPASAQ